MANPNNAIGTNAAYEGRTSVDAFNDVLGILSRGILSGWQCAPDSGLTVTIGGASGVRDVAIAEDNVGNRTTINNISRTPISVTLSAAPATNSRIDSIVLYVDNPPQGNSSDADNPAACGLVVVEGTAAATPSIPDDNAIRTAITNEGANGTAAYYVVVANITIAAGTTIITQNLIQTISMFDFRRLTFTSKDITTTATTIVTYTAKTPGTYLISANVTFRKDGGSSAELLLGGKKNTTVLGVVGAYTAPDNRRTPVSGTWVARLNVGDSLIVEGTTTNGNIWTMNEYSTIYVARIN